MFHKSLNDGMQLLARRNNSLVRIIQQRTICLSKSKPASSFSTSLFAKPQSRFLENTVVEEEMAEDDGSNKSTYIFY